MYPKSNNKGAKKCRITDLKIISGVGVREYYRKFGYKVDDEGYVEKKI